jgi:hemolysin-activating ACP:hemolysin acyltransferase
MDFIFDKDKLKDMHDVISLYKKFDRYKDSTREDLYYHILPSFKLNQYKIHKDKNDMIAFTNWAFLNKDTEKKFIQTGDLEDNSWNNGNELWHIDTVCVKNIKKVMTWTKQHFTKVLGLNQPINWLRISDDNKIYRKTTRFTKESWLNG